MNLLKIDLKTDQIKNVTRVIESGLLSSTHGNEVALFEQELAEKIRIKYGIAVNSGTAALHVALLILGIGAGDEVIVPACSFVATAAAVRIVGARPVFVDIEKHGYGMDINQFINAIGPKTAAVIPVHIAGIPCRIEEILNIARLEGIWVIEDACQALGAKFKGQNVGTFGDIGCFSFYPGKVITTGEGGMLVTDSTAIAERAKAARNHGRINDEYVNFGWNYRMTEIAGALGRAAMMHYDKIMFNQWMKAADELLKTELEAPLIPYHSQILPPYLPLKQGYELEVKEFYPPIYRLPGFNRVQECPNAEDAYKRTKIVRI